MILCWSSIIETYFFGSTSLFGTATLFCTHGCGGVVPLSNYYLLPLFYHIILLAPWHFKIIFFTSFYQIKMSLIKIRHSLDHLCWASSLVQPWLWWCYSILSEKKQTWASFFHIRNISNGKLNVIWMRLFFTLIDCLTKSCVCVCMWPCLEQIILRIELNSCKIILLLACFRFF